MTDNEADYDGWDPDEVPEAIQAEEDADILHSEGYHIEEEPEEESEVIEMEIEEGDIYAMIVDEHDNEIGFILLDEDGNEQGVLLRRRGQRRRRRARGAHLGRR